MRISPYGLNSVPSWPRPDQTGQAELTKPALPAKISPQSTSTAEGTHSSAGTSFGDILTNVIRTEDKAQSAVDAYANGTSQDIPETMIALQKADISLSILLNVRNKLIDAYREVMRMS